MNNYAFSLDSQGKHEKSREILEDMLNDGDAPDTARLLMARHRMQAFLAKTTRLTLSQPIDECIDELKSDDLLGACQGSAFRSLMLAKLEHTCCTAYASEARRSQQQLSEEENRKWLTHSRAAIRDYEDAVEQGMAPYMWNLITASLHPEIKDTRTYRERYTQFVENGPKHKVIHYRRRFLQDPVVGTRFERWKEATLEEGAALTDTSSNQAASEPTRAVATAR